VVAENDWVIAPVDINAELPRRVNVTLPPAQRSLIRAVMLGVAGAAFTVTVVPAPALWQPEASVARTVYVPEVVAEID
jgi:hypothetical protein